MKLKKIKSYNGKFYDYTLVVDDEGYIYREGNAYFGNNEEILLTLPLKTNDRFLVENWKAVDWEERVYDHDAIKGSTLISELISLAQFHDIRPKRIRTVEQAESLRDELFSKLEKRKQRIIALEKHEFNANRVSALITNLVFVPLAFMYPTNAIWIILVGHAFLVFDRGVKKEGIAGTFLIIAAIIAYLLPHGGEGQLFWLMIMTVISSHIITKGE